MCVKSSATDGLPSITRASSPPSGRARSRLTRMALFRSQESSRASSRLWSCVADIMTSVRFQDKCNGVYDNLTQSTQMNGPLGLTSKRSAQQPLLPTANHVRIRSIPVEDFKNVLADKSVRPTVQSAREETSYGRPAAECQYSQCAEG